jgi:hypothetical protein
MYKTDLFQARNIFLTGLILYHFTEYRAASFLLKYYQLFSDVSRQGFQLVEVDAGSQVTCV